jgi:hypothetical protein
MRGKCKHPVTLTDQSVRRKPPAQKTGAGDCKKRRSGCHLLNSSNSLSADLSKDCEKSRQRDSGTAPGTSRALVLPLLAYHIGHVIPTDL